MKVDMNNAGIVTSPVPETDGSGGKQPVSGGSPAPAADAPSGREAVQAGTEPGSSPGNTAAASPASQSQLLIEHSIKALLEQLTKSLSVRIDLLQALPPDIRGQAERMLQQAMPDAMSDGLLSLLKAQNNSSEQLKALSNTLSYFSAASTQPSGKLPDSVILLLKQAVQLNIKDTGSGSAGIDAPVLLKLANQLSEHATQSQAAAAIQQIWNNSLLANSTKTGPDFFQLIKSFLGTPQGQNEGTAKQTADAPAVSGSGGQNSATAAAKQAVPEAGQTTANMKSQPSVQLPAAITTAANFTARSAETAPQGTAVNPAANKLPAAGQQAVPKDGMQTLTPGRTADTETVIKFVKELAQNIVTARQPQLVKNDVAALKQLFSNSQSAAADKDWLTLTRLLEASVQSMPPAIRQAGDKVSELHQLWVLQQLGNTAELTGLPRKTLDSTSKLLEQLAQTLKSSFMPGGETMEGQRSVSFTMPLYLGENQQSYPAYIHVYHQAEESGTAASGQERETWLRICLNTENAGVVDLVFRLYKDNQLNLRIGMGDHNAVQLFNGFIPEIKTAIETTPLILAEISVGAIGGK